MEITLKQGLLINLAQPAVPSVPRSTGAARDFPDWRMAFRRVDAASILRLRQARSDDGATL